MQTPADRLKFLRERAPTIGSSDAAAILCESTYKTPGDVWRRITGRTPIDETVSKAAERGHMLEAVVADWWAGATGHGICADGMRKHPTYQYLTANVDRWIPDLDLALECKTASGPAADDFGAEDTDEVPVPYYLQCLHQAVVCGINRVHLAVLIGGFAFEFRKYVLDFSPEIKSEYTATVVRWWREHVETDTCPPPVTLSDTRAMYPYDTGEPIVATEEAAEACERYVMAREAEKSAKAYKDEEAITIQSAMQDAPALLSIHGRELATWKTAKSGRRTFRVKGD